MDQLIGIGHLCSPTNFPLLLKIPPNGLNAFGIIPSKHSADPTGTSDCDPLMKKSLPSQNECSHMRGMFPEFPIVENGLTVRLII